MRKLFSTMIGVFALMAFLILPVIAFAQAVTPPETVEQASGLLPALIEALMTGKSLVAVAIAVMIGTVGVRQYVLPKLGLSNALLPWVSLGLAALLGIASHVAGGVDPKVAAETVLVAGGLASQFWSLGGKVFIDWVMKAFGSKGVA